MIVTRCPACQTAFRVTPEQLRVRQGRVRCGKCRQVFNALESLVYQSDTPAVRSSTGAPADAAVPTETEPSHPSPDFRQTEDRAPDAPAEAPQASQEEPVSPPARDLAFPPLEGLLPHKKEEIEEAKEPPPEGTTQEPRPGPGPGEANSLLAYPKIGETAPPEPAVAPPAPPPPSALPAGPPTPQPEPPVQPFDALNPPTLMEGEPAGAVGAPKEEAPRKSKRRKARTADEGRRARRRDVEEHEQEADEARHPRRPPEPVLWGAAVVLSFAVLIAQLLIVFRSEIAAANPGLRPTLEAWCSVLGCEVAFPHNAELVSIEASDLHADPGNRNLLVLQATVKNRAAFAQAYPLLELTLTDARDDALARRVFLPAEYLPPGTSGRKVFPPNGEVVVNLWLDARSVGASGYRLYVFYP